MKVFESKEFSEWLKFRVSAHPSLPQFMPIAPAGSRWRALGKRVQYYKGNRRKKTEAWICEVCYICYMSAL